MPLVLTDKKRNKIGRIDQAVRDYFEQHPSVDEVAARELMPLFIQRGIFLQDYNKGFPIRLLLQQLHAAGKLQIIEHCKVIRKEGNKAWYFGRG